METVRVACWSGPRNISTAMMRSWGSRAGCVVVDEPLYASYLSGVDGAKRAEHPGWEEILESQSRDWRSVVRRLAGDLPSGGVWYQKHMGHHVTHEMLGEPAFLEFVRACRHVLLVREPREMITSFVKVMPNPTAEDLGLPRQVELAGVIERETGTRPVIVDSRAVLEDPRGELTRMCSGVGLDFDEAMLRWEPGPRPEDGIWAPHWYASVEQSTGFGAYRAKDEEVPDRLAGVLAECEDLYTRLRES
ncbi:MAG: HAD family hydrolase [Phycisphaerales bacterium JB040]